MLCPIDTFDGVQNMLKTTENLNHSMRTSKLIKAHISLQNFFSGHFHDIKITTMNPLIDGSKVIS